MLSWYRFTPEMRTPLYTGHFQLRGSTVYYFSSCGAYVLTAVREDTHTHVHTHASQLYAEAGMLYEKAPCWDKATSVYIKSKSRCVCVQCDSIGHLHVFTHYHAITFDVVSCSVNISVCVCLGEEEIVIFHT